MKTPETPAQREWRLVKLRAARRKHQDKFLAIWKGAGFQPLEEEARIFAEDGRRFDFAERRAKVAVEIQGQIWKKGGHTSGTGMMRDCRKSFDAAMLGWVVIPMTPDMLGFVTLRQIHELIQRRLQ